MAGRWLEHTHAGLTQPESYTAPHVPGLWAARPAVTVTVSSAPRWHPALRQPLTHRVGASQTRVGLVKKWGSIFQITKPDSARVSDLPGAERRQGCDLRSGLSDSKQGPSVGAGSSQAWESTSPGLAASPAPS